MMYQCVFFDLDRTLWDLERNSAETLYDLFYYFRLSKYITDVQQFICVYNENNRRLWTLYHENKIKKNDLQWRRFYDTLAFFGVKHTDLAKKMSFEFVRIIPLKTGLMPFALEAVDFLSKKYSLYIITNGFEEIQHLKLLHSGLSSYFKALITSEQTGFLKPDVRIFEHALSKANTYSSKSIMIGDEYDTDIVGAQNAGIDTVFYCPNSNFGDGNATYKINSLEQLIQLL